MVDCKTYRAIVPEKTCVLRVKRTHNKMGFISTIPADPGCAKCETGDKLYQQYIKGNLELKR